MLDGDLRQQKSATALTANKKTMAADFDFIGPNRSRWRENTQLNFESQRLFYCDWGKTVVIESGGAGGFRNGAVDWTARQHVADTPAQFALQIERSESPARFGKMGSR